MTDLGLPAVVHPRLRGPAEHLIVEVKTIMMALFAVTVEHVFQAYPALAALVMTQVCSTYHESCCKLPSALTLVMQCIICLGMDTHFSILVLCLCSQGS